MNKTEALESMLTIRRFEEAVVGLFGDHEFMTHFHLYIGQESTGVPLMAALGPDDKLATHHRNHGHILARGADPKLALAEILGRENGINRGAGGTMHMSDVDRGFISTSAIVGGSISLATGAGFALKTRGGDAVAVGLFGDGALEEGVSYESLNLGALYSLPVVYVCENNSEGALGSAGGGFPTSVSAVDDLTDIPKTFGIPVETVDGRDADAVLDVATRAVDHCRRRKGPFFIHAVTARFAGTQPLWPTLPTGATDISMAWDDSAVSGEHEQWYRENDPVLRYARQLLGAGELSQDELTELDARARERIAEARRFALDSPRPTPESALDNVFA
ncbi:MAG: acetoin:2,6-dichlorophenolindophenol oxidoreductase subunit alpha [Thermoleophilaceae bacterium]|jgi:TPP-dependent pyruvate/acetoin dehydrogenase alpha subunit|nr:acetoin:2,6-dichlorophenolindophenol oxidoreductase subunit alpha [Thermoleophilaceae bacterium]MEA2400868.1 acetoin:2,6-dichlorophenolindophenol oxidoreductase subunit alpha [Thermoleophilaceae bacterium]MEA2454863.1 acetoin:2,6-dichlorophenolindophenol oxidoreductase subunit alpha [Thermoleophilaceae bacterium]